MRPALARARSAAVLQPRVIDASAGGGGGLRRLSSGGGEHGSAATSLKLRSSASSGSLPLSSRVAAGGALVPASGSRVARQPRPYSPPPADILMGQRVVVVGLPADASINGHGGTVVGRDEIDPSLVILALNAKSSLDTVVPGDPDGGASSAAEGAGTARVPEDNLRTLLYFAASNGIADTVAAEINQGARQEPRTSDQNASPPLPGPSPCVRFLPRNPLALSAHAQCSLLLASLYSLSPPRLLPPLPAATVQA